MATKYPSSAVGLVLASRLPPAPSLAPLTTALSLSGSLHRFQQISYCAAWRRGGEGWRGIILWILLFTHRILHPVLSPGTSSADTAATTGATLGLQVEILHHTYIFCRLMSSLYSCTNCTILVLYLRNHEQKKVDMCNVEESSSFRVL